MLDLKGIVKDYKLHSAISNHALRGLLDVLENNTEVEPAVVLSGELPTIQGNVV